MTLINKLKYLFMWLETAWRSPPLRKKKKKIMMLIDHAVNCITCFKAEAAFSFIGAENHEKKYLGNVGCFINLIVSLIRFLFGLSWERYVHEGMNAQTHGSASNHTNNQI